MRQMFFPFPWDTRPHVAAQRSLAQWDENEQSYILKSLAVGLAQEDIAVTVRGRTLTLQTQHHNEWSTQGHKREWVLPQDADVSGIVAALSRGVLTVTVPRVELQETTIEVKDHGTVFEQPQQ